ncbi:uncharacterized protein LOC142339816 isoform X2 [Convolutriloba macropyga]|uniref:uncharacterized protein LOC142339816 isoform X2 n=1 Tax=Convolutriloba macropyga TaxID=536237 RepID=UPI003F527781
MNLKPNYVLASLVALCFVIFRLCDATKTQTVDCGSPPSKCKCSNAGVLSCKIVEDSENPGEYVVYLVGLKHSPTKEFVLDSSEMKDKNVLKRIVLKDMALSRVESNTGHFLMSSLLRQQNLLGLNLTRLIVIDNENTFNFTTSDFRDSEKKYPNNDLRIEDLPRVSFIGNLVNFSLTLPKYLKVNKFDLLNQTLTNKDLMIKLVKEKDKDVVINWDVSKLDPGKRFYPKLFAPKEEFKTKLTLTVFNDVKENLNWSKDCTAYAGSIDQIALPSQLEAIEYGSLSNTDKFRANKIAITSDLRVVAEFELNSSHLDSWNSGRCRELRWNNKPTYAWSICELCFMHQTKDKVSQMCEGTINAPTRMRRCYWKDFDEVPDSLPNKADVAVRFEEKEIRVGKLCFSDIEDLDGDDNQHRGKATSNESFPNRYEKQNRAHLIIISKTSIFNKLHLGAYSISVTLLNYLQNYE